MNPTTNSQWDTLDDLIRRLWLPLTILFVILITVVISGPGTERQPAVICSEWAVTGEDTVRIVDYQCHETPKPDFARSVIYRCPLTSVTWPDAEDNGLIVKLNRCEVDYYARWN